MDADDRRSPVQRAARHLGVDGAPASGLLLLLLLADAAIIGSYLSMEYLGEPMHPTFELANDRGFGEFFQYVQTGWATVLLVLLAVRRRAGVYTAWALVCAYFVIDDGLQVHEQAGTAIGEAAPLLDPVGELVWIGVVGAVLSAVVLLAHHRADAADRAVSRVVAVIFGVLILFGVVFDAIYLLFLDQPLLSVPFVTLEDGGEIVTMSFLVAFLFAVAYAGHRPSPDRDVGDLERVGAPH